MTDFFDAECLALAEYFLERKPGGYSVDDLIDLARHIRNSIDGWLYLRAQYPGALPNDILACDDATP